MQNLFSDFEKKIKSKELSNFRSLSVFTAMTVTLLGFALEIAYYDLVVLLTGLGVSLLFTLNYYFSFRSAFYKKHFANISYGSIFIVHFWEVYVVREHNFEITFLLPVALSIFIFSLAFDRFYKSVAFIFVITSFMMVMMFFSQQWQTNYAIAVVTLYSGCILAYIVLQKRNSYHLEIFNRDKKYIALVENMNSGLTYIDSQHRLLFANDKFCKMIGYHEEGISGEKISAFLAAESPLISFENFLAELNAGSTMQFECMMQKKNKDLIWVRMSGSPFYNDNGSRNGSMIIHTDITELKDTQERLKKREEGYRTFIDQSAVGIWRAEYKPPIPLYLPVEKQIDLLLNTGFISECNDFMAQMYGYNRSSELTGRKIKDFYSFENNFDQEKTHGILQAFIENNYRINNSESKEVDRHGNTRYILNNNIGIIEDDCLVRTWGVQTDITERKKTEHDLIETSQELDTFFYKASHDLKGPLASVMGIVNLARMENQDELMEKYFKMVESSVTKLDGTLLDLVELARARKGCNKLSEINVKELMQETLNSLKHLSNFDSINFELQIDSSLQITADKVLMLSVIQNLVQNSVNYCNPVKPWIQIRAIETEEGIELEIADNGKGIPEKVKDKVFEMFYRGNSDSNGSGLGLFIVKNALEKMHGKIHFESKEEKGSTFYVSIPNALVEA
jgi:PAS domain S-box-containing protein